MFKRIYFIVLTALCVLFLTLTSYFAMMGNKNALPFALWAIVVTVFVILQYFATLKTSKNK